MPWWFWILAVIWSIPIVMGVACAIWMIYEDHAAEKMIKRRTAEARALALVERNGPTPSQQGNPRARP